MKILFLFHLATAEWYKIDPFPDLHHGDARFRYHVRFFEFLKFQRLWRSATQHMRLLFHLALGVNNNPAKVDHRWEQLADISLRLIFG